MPTYLSDAPDITTDVANIQRRLAVLENNTSNNFTSTSPVNGAPLPPGSGGAAVSDGSITYVKLAPDVPTTFDTRYLRLVGGTVTGNLAVNAPMTIGNGGTPQSLVLTGTLNVTSTSLLSGTVTLGTNLLLSGNSAVVSVGSVGNANSPVLDFHSAGFSNPYDVRFASVGGSAGSGTGALSIFSASTTFSGTVTAPNLVNSITAGNQAVVTGTAAVPVVGISATPTFTSATIPILSGITTIPSGIGGSTGGVSDNSSFGWDAGSNRIGFSKKSTQYGKLAYANATFAITQYVGQTNIDPTNAQTDRLTLDPSGLLTVPGAVSFGSTLGVTGTSTFTGAVALSGGLSTKDIITGGAGAGIGNLASATIDTYNIKDGAVTGAKISGATIATRNVATGTLRDTDHTMFRAVSATGSLPDGAGQETDALFFGGTTPPTRVVDGLAFGGYAAKFTAGTTSAYALIYGPYYKGLKAGSYKVTFYVRTNSISSTAALTGAAVNATAGYLSPNNTLTYWSPAQIGSTNYVGITTTFTALQDLAPSSGLETYLYWIGGQDLYFSHVTVEPFDPLVQGQVTTTFISDLAVTSAKINDLSATKITAGTLTADITQSGVIRTGPDTGARVLLNSGGLYAYSDATTNTVQILNTGAVTITGTINATGGTFTGTVQGGTFQGGTFQTGTGSVSVVRFDSTGIKSYTPGGIAAFTVDTAGNLTATAATITGQVNASSGTFSGTITATGTISGGIISGATVTGGSINIASGTFAVNASGALTASSATITGTINATGGTFSGTISANAVTITGGILTSAHITATDINATNTISGLAILAGTIRSGSVTVTTAAENSILNGGFEDLNNDDTTVANWTVGYDTTGTGATTAPTGTLARSGSRSMLVSVPANVGTAFASSSVPVAVGEVYSIRGYVQPNTYAGPVYVRVLFGTAENFARTSLIAGTPAVPVVTAPANANPAAAAGYADLLAAYSFAAAGSFNLVDGTVTVPAGAMWMRLALYAWINGTGAWSANWDDWVIRKQVGTTMIADGIITTPKIIATGISGTVIQANTLSAQSITTSTLNSSTLLTVGTAGGASVLIDGRSATAGARLLNGSAVTTVNLDATTGNATFTGTVNATSGTFSGTVNVTGTLSVTGTINGGYITGANISGGSVTGTIVQTATSGARVAMSSTNANQIQFFSGAANEYMPGVVVAGTFTYGSTTYPQLTVQAGRANSTYNSPGIAMSANSGTLQGQIVMRGDMGSYTTGAVLSYGNSVEMYSASSGLILGSNSLTYNGGGTITLNGNLSMGSGYQATFNGNLTVANGYQISAQYIYQNGYGVFTLGNPPPYPVTSVNGGNNLSVNQSTGSITVSDRSDPSYSIVNASNHMAAPSYYALNTSSYFYPSSPGSNYVVNGYGKTFVIDHPTPSKRDTSYLVHAAVEGPTADVFYRGKGTLVPVEHLETDPEGYVHAPRAVVRLPDYFEDIAEVAGRTVMVTPIVGGCADPGCDAWMPPSLAATTVVDGQFMVVAVAGYIHDCCDFFWEVKAVRKDISQFDVEPKKSDVVLHGDGPYTYLSPRTI